MLAPARRPVLDGSLRPLCRGLVLATALGLPALGALAAERLSEPSPQPEPVRLALATGAAR
ncbi:hypothetical protein [Methylobacterium sp. Leaf456]|uniref:hypothetical protein n=1 Tax=Methylobacterium sp. Leaf456 TaxID=1736382 RepID=UPI0012E33132|nr:hypothetical protein [Methylobacterium sp. Leaf456]